jgi:hypothetical protein
MAFRCFSRISIRVAPPFCESMARRNEETTHPDATRLGAGNSTVRKHHRAVALTPMEFNLLLA